MSDINWRIGGYTPTLSFMDSPTGRGHAMLEARTRLTEDSGD